MKMKDKCKSQRNIWVGVNNTIKLSLHARDEYIHKNDLPKYITITGSYTFKEFKYM